MHVLVLKIFFSFCNFCCLAFVKFVSSAAKESGHALLADIVLKFGSDLVLANLEATVLLDYLKC